MTRRSLENGVAIVTGASSGIGRALAIQLAEADVQLCLTARRADRLQSLVSDIRGRGGRAFDCPGDITDQGLRSQLLERTLATYGAIDFLINNAGVGAMGRFDSASPQRLRQIMEVNFFAPAELIRTVLPTLVSSHRALIVNMGSVLGHRAVGLKSEYCASKFALHGLSDALRVELAARKIDVLLVSPSTTDSEFFDAAIEDSSGVDNWKGRRVRSPEWVARKTLAAMRRGAHEVVLTPGGKLLVWLDRLAPGLANRLITASLSRQQ